MFTLAVFILTVFFICFVLVVIVAEKSRCLCNEIEIVFYICIETVEIKSK